MFSLAIICSTYLKKKDIGFDVSLYSTVLYLEVQFYPFLQNTDHKKNQVERKLKSKGG